MILSVCDFTKVSFLVGLGGIGEIRTLFAAEVSVCIARVKPCCNSFSSVVF